MAARDTRSGVSGHGAERVHVVVRGRVQGVGFRWFVVRAAAGLGLDGWVMNRADRAVELVAEGQVERLDELVVILRRGSPASSVQSLDVTRSPASGDFHGFHIRSGDHSGD